MNVPQGRLGQQGPGYELVYDKETLLYPTTVYFFLIFLKSLIGMVAELYQVPFQELSIGWYGFPFLIY